VFEPIPGFHLNIPQIIPASAHIAWREKIRDCPSANSVIGAAVAITLLLQMLQNPAEHHGNMRDAKVQHLRRNITGIGQTRV